MQVSTSFLQTMLELHRDRSAPQKHYLYSTAENRFTVHSITAAPEKSEKLLIGKIVECVSSYRFDYSKPELGELKTAVQRLKGRVDEKRQGWFLQRIIRCVSSAIFNFVHGFGLHDSSNLLSQAIEKIDERIKLPSCSIEGDIAFTDYENSTLSELFSPKNIPLLRKKQNEFLIHGKSIKITYSHQTFEIDAFPGLIFWSDFYGSRGRYQTMQNAKAACRDEGLTHLMVSDCSEIKISGAVFLAERKLPAELKAFCADEEIVRELTLFTCKTKYPLADWNIQALSDQDKVALVNLTEPAAKITLLHGFIGYYSGNRHEGIAGLFGCFPRYAEMIYNTAQKALSSSEFEAIRAELDQARTKAMQVIEREQDIQRFHEAHSITLESPAIAEGIESQMSDKYKQVISDINEVIKNQRNRSNLIQAREWRLTMDAYTADSNFSDNICNNNSEILDELLPYLKQMGVVHSILDSAQAHEMDIDLRRRIGNYDHIVQF